MLLTHPTYFVRAFSLVVFTEQRNFGSAMLSYHYCKLSYYNGEITINVTFENLEFRIIVDAENVPVQNLNVNTRKSI